MKYADNIRTLVRGRLTKNDNFKLGTDSYLKRQAEVENMLADMTVQEIYEKFPIATCDLR